ncbi:MAG: hypothetical protein HY520_05100 [Candidatus Aenigmarchaeota archaeon]|nr:hypothetical protein [Candidatus Aenigmarchaeota archaeon]
MKQSFPGERVKQLLPLLVAFALVLPAAAAQPVLEYYGIEDNVEDNLQVRHVITLRFAEPVPQLDYQVNFPVANLTVRATFDQADCAQQGSAISCNLGGITQERNQLILSYDTAGSIREQAGKLVYAPSYSFLPTNKSFVIIRLPPTATLSEDVANRSFSPSSGGILSDGKRIMVFWEMRDLPQGAQQFSVSFSLPPKLPDTPLLVTLALLVVIVMVGVVVYGRRRRQEHEDAVSSVLNPDETALVEILKRGEGRALQKTLVKESGFSKAKVSRLVKDLRERGVVEVEPVSGRENRILLTLGKEKPKEQPTPPANSAPAGSPPAPPSPAP